MATIALAPPRAFVVGSTVQWRIKDVDYPAPDWVATLAFVASSDSQVITATDNGDGTHLVEIDDAASVLFVPGIYRYQVNVTDGSNRFSIRTGVIEALPNYADAGDGLDDRSPNARIYDAITAILVGKASTDQSSMSVEGRSLSRYSWEELMSARGAHAHMLTDDERLARGFMPRGAQRVRFTR